jgi:hypothetical protein
MLPHPHHITQFWHKPLFPMDATDYAGVFCAALGLILASGGGIGGGGMLVPLYVLVMVRRRAPSAGFARSTDTRARSLGSQPARPHLRLAISLSPIILKANTVRTRTCLCHLFSSSSSLQGLFAEARHPALERDGVWGLAR